MKLECEYGRSDKASKSKVLWEAWFHEPTYISDTPASEPEVDPAEPCSLFVRRYRLSETPRGKLRATMLLDVEQFDDEEAMVVSIQERHLTECPEDREWAPTFLRAAREEGRSESCSGMTFDSSHREEGQ